MTSQTLLCSKHNIYCTSHGGCLEARSLRFRRFRHFEACLPWSPHMQAKSAHDAPESLNSLHLWQAEVMPPQLVLATTLRKDGHARSKRRTELSSLAFACSTAAPPLLCLQNLAPCADTLLVALQQGVRPVQTPAEVAQRKERLKEWSVLLLSSHAQITAQCLLKLDSCQP